MKTKLFLSLALITAFILIASSLPVNIPVVQASTPHEASVIAAPQPVDDAADAERISIASQPLAQGVVGLIALMFGALTIMPLLSMDAQSGVAGEERGIKFDQH